MASNAASTPYQAYSGELVAGQNATQTQAYNQVAGLQGSTTPYYGAANTDFNNATSNVSNGVQAANASNIAQYSNPYQQQVINATQAQLNQNDSVQSQQQTGNAISAGAFGGDREAASQALLGNQQDLANNQTIAGLNSANYTQALGQLNTENQQQISENEANNQNSLNAGTAQEGLGTTALTSGLQGANALLQTGNQQQQLQQSQDTAAYQQWENQLAFPYQQAGFYANIAEGLGSQMGGTSNTNQSENSGYDSTNWNLSLARGGKVRKKLASGGPSDGATVDDSAPAPLPPDPATQANDLYTMAKTAPVKDNMGSPDIPPQYTGGDQNSEAPAPSDSSSGGKGIISGLGGLAGRFLGPSNAHTSSGYSVDPGMSIAKGLIAGLAGPTPNPLLNIAFGAMYGLNDYGKQQAFVEHSNNDSNEINARDQQINDDNQKNQTQADLERQKIAQSLTAQQEEAKFRDWSMKHGDQELAVQQQAASRKGIIPVKTPMGDVLYDLDNQKVVSAPGLPGYAGANGTPGVSANPNFGFDVSGYAQNPTTLKAAQNKTATEDATSIAETPIIANAKNELSDLTDSINNGKFTTGLGSNLRAKGDSALALVGDNDAAARAANYGDITSNANNLVNEMAKMQYVPGGRASVLALKTQLAGKPATDNQLANNQDLIGNLSEKVYGADLYNQIKSNYKDANPLKFVDPGHVASIADALNQKYPLTTRANGVTSFNQDNYTNQANAITDAIANPAKYGIKNGIVRSVSDGQGASAQAPKVIKYDAQGNRVQ